MPSRIRIFDHGMKILTELNVPSKRSWVINDIGQCEFTISTSDEKCKREYLEYGNLVLVDHIPSKRVDGTLGGVLPSWVGVILPPRSWEYGSVNIVAYGAEAILDFRPVPYVTLNGTTGYVFSEIIRSVRPVSGAVVIDVGTVEDDAKNKSETLRTSALDHVIRLIQHSGFDFRVRGEVDDQLGVLRLYADWFVNMGVDTLRSLNNTNTENSAPLLSEEGTLVNLVFGYGQSSTDGARAAGSGSDQDSINDYGVLATNEVFQGTNSPGSVEEAAKNKVKSQGRPVMTVALNALDVDDTFSYLNLGNVWTYYNRHVGFDGDGIGFTRKVRITGMEYDDQENVCKLIVEVQ